MALFWHLDSDSCERYFTLLGLLDTKLAEDMAVKVRSHKSLAELGF